MGSMVVRGAHCSCVSPNVAARNPNGDLCCLVPSGGIQRENVLPTQTCSPGDISLRRKELPQHLLDLGVLLLDGRKRLLDAREALLLVRLVDRAGRILLMSVVLDLLAAVLDLCEAECGGGTFEKVSQG